MRYPLERKPTQELQKLGDTTSGHQTHANLAATQLRSNRNLGVVDALDAVTER